MPSCVLDEAAMGGGAGTLGTEDYPGDGGGRESSLLMVFPISPFPWASQTSVTSCRGGLATWPWQGL